MESRHEAELAAQIAELEGRHKAEMEAALQAQQVRMLAYTRACAAESSGGPAARAHGSTVQSS